MFGCERTTERKKLKKRKSEENKKEGKHMEMRCEWEGHV